MVEGFEGRESFLFVFLKRVDPERAWPTSTVLHAIAERGVGVGRAMVR